MSGALALTVLRIAVRCLGAHRGDWARAMEAEYEAAAQDGRGLAFAAGCLAAALREMPAHEEGRFVIASYVLAVGLIVPVSVLIMSGMLTQFGLSLDEANRSAVPSLGFLLLLLTAAHMRIAWALLERDWEGVAAIGRMTGAMTLTLAIFSAVVFVSTAGLVHAAVVAVELLGILVLTQWHARLFAARQERSLAAH